MSWKLNRRSLFAWVAGLFVTGPAIAAKATGEPSFARIWDMLDRMGPLPKTSTMTIIGTRWPSGGYYDFLEYVPSHINFPDKKPDPR